MSYEGKVAGIAFQNGQATFDKDSLDARLEKSLATVVRELLDLGYTVVALTAENEPVEKSIREVLKDLDKAEKRKSKSKDPDGDGEKADSKEKK